jgi:hypothetical protein
MDVILDYDLNVNECRKREFIPDENKIYRRMA